MMMINRSMKSILKCAVIVSSTYMMATYGLPSSSKYLPFHKLHKTQCHHQSKDGSSSSLLSNTSNDSKSIESAESTEEIKVNDTETKEETTTTRSEGKEDGEKEEDKDEEEVITNKEPVVVEEYYDDPDEEVDMSPAEHCGFCSFFLNSPCKREFHFWRKCVESKKENGQDFTEACIKYTTKLALCVDMNKLDFGEGAEGGDGEGSNDSENNDGVTTGGENVSTTVPSSEIEISSSNSNTVAVVSPEEEEKK